MGGSYWTPIYPYEYTVDKLPYFFPLCIWTCPEWRAAASQRAQEEHACIMHTSLAMPLLPILSSWRRLILW